MYTKKLSPPNSHVVSFRPSAYIGNNVVRIPSIANIRTSHTSKQTLPPPPPYFTLTSNFTIQRPTPELTTRHTQTYTSSLTSNPPPNQPFERRSAMRRPSVDPSHTITSTLVRYAVSLRSAITFEHTFRPNGHTREHNENIYIYISICINTCVYLGAVLLYLQKSVCCMCVFV